MGKRSRVGLQWSFLLTDVSYRDRQRRNTFLGTSYFNFSAASAMRVSSAPQKVELDKAIKTLKG